jgi:aspartyl-tRNA(Asn)/glutamyl-tRNA(Gln) amidotransferase subunit C
LCCNGKINLRIAYLSHFYACSIDIIDAMGLTIEEVEHIADLARLELTEEEKTRFREQLSNILAYAARLQAIDTSQISPTASVLLERSLLREDAAEEGMSIEQVLKNAPSIGDHQFRVPPVME